VRTKADLGLPCRERDLLLQLCQENDFAFVSTSAKENLNGRAVIEVIEMIMAATMYDLMACD
jgi:hypothetical protein